MIKQNLSDAKIKGESFLKSLWANPNVKLGVNVALQIAVIAGTAFVGYRQGKKVGNKHGQIQGYAAALDHIGVTPAEVPTLASAWAEGKAANAQALADMTDAVLA